MRSEFPVDPPVKPVRHRRPEGTIPTINAEDSSIAIGSLGSGQQVVQESGEAQACVVESLAGDGVQLVARNHEEVGQQVVQESGEAQACVVESLAGECGKLVARNHDEVEMVNMTNAKDGFAPATLDIDETYV